MVLVQYTLKEKKQRSSRQVAQVAVSTCICACIAEGHELPTLAVALQLGLLLPPVKLLVIHVPPDPSACSPAAKPMPHTHLLQLPAGRYLAC